MIVRKQTQPTIGCQILARTNTASLKYALRLALKFVEFNFLNLQVLRAAGQSKKIKKNCRTNIFSAAWLALAAFKCHLSLKPAIVAPVVLTIYFLAFFAPQARAEYRAYYYEVFDKVANYSWEVSTGFDPVSYVRTNGKQGSINIQIKASWLCRGVTSFRKVCPMPAPLGARYMLGQEVTINLPKNISDKWRGKIELIYWRADLNSNVYGIRFEENNNLYGNYFERDLTTANAGSTPIATPQANQGLNQF